MNIRGNQPSIKFRYLEIRMNQDMNHSLRTLFPNQVSEFDKYENVIYQNIVPFIHDAYMRRFIKKDHVTVPPPEYKVIKDAHTWYSEDRDSRKVTKYVISDFLNMQKPSSINRMIKRVLYPNQYNNDSRIENKMSNMTVGASEENKMDVDTNKDDMDVV